MLTAGTLNKKTYSGRPYDIAMEQTATGIIAYTGSASGRWSCSSSVCSMADTMLCEMAGRSLREDVAQVRHVVSCASASLLSYFEHKYCK